MNLIIGIIVTIFLIILSIFDNNILNNEIIGGSLDKTKPEYILNDAEVIESKILPPFERTITENTRSIKYRENSQGWYRYTMHSGQRKLLLSEIEFLTIYGDLAKKVIYVGAAPGHHIPLLSKLFPKHHFYLYDKTKFAFAPTPKMMQFHKYFTDDEAKIYKDDSVLFISDIRTVDNINNNTKWDEEIIDNMNDQQRWVDILKPAMSIIKFRLSWHQKNQKYLDGTIFLQIWAPLTSTETRLVTDGKKMRTWDTNDYEDKMYRFNAITRQQHWDVPKEVLKNVAGSDHCYDCAAEVHILKHYQNKFSNKYTKMRVSEFMNIISHTLKKGLDKFPHGVCRDIVDINNRYQCVYNNY